MAGAAAAVVALGITSAILVAGRGGRVRDDDLARSVADGEPLADGESAAGGDVGLDGGSPGAPTSNLAPSAADASDALGAAARRTVNATPAAPAPAPAPVLTPAAPAPQPAPPAVAPQAPPPAPAAEPAVELTVGVEGVVGLTIGDQCNGIDLAGTTLGCAPATTGAPLEVITDGTLLNALGL